VLPVWERRGTLVMQLALFGAGPQRTGTSWLDACLREHPQLCFPAGVKETAFLDTHFENGWAWYWSHFQHWQQGQFCAEMGPQAFDVPAAATRLWEHNPACRVIISLRDPVERSFSLWLLLRRKGILGEDFAEASQKVPHILDSSRYREHISRWLRVFGPQQVLVILLEDIAASPEPVLERVYTFAGIRPMPMPAVASERVGASTLPASSELARLASRGATWLRQRRLYAPINLAKRLGLKSAVFGGSRQALPELHPELRQRLVREFEPDIAYVEDLLGRSLTSWRE
jgi:hypothetical protein